MAVEQPAPPQQPSGLRAFISRPIAGIPVWGWFGIGIVGVGVAWFFFWRQGSNTSSATTASQNQTTTGLGIDPSSGLPYATNGTGGLNPAGAFAGEQQYDPFANTNNLLQQLLANNQANTNPPTSFAPIQSGHVTVFPGDANNPNPVLVRQVTLNQPMSWDQLAQQYYNGQNAGWLLAWNQHLNSNAGATLPAGTVVNIPSTRAVAA